MNYRGPTTLVFVLFVTALIAACGPASRSSFAPTVVNTYTPPDIIRYAELGNLEGVRGEIAAGTPVNETDRWGFSALHRAAERGHTEVMNLLMSAGADTSLKTDSGFTAESLARDSGSQEALSLLSCARVGDSSCSAEREAFSACQQLDDIDACHDYLASYPQGLFADVATGRIKSIRARELAQRSEQEKAAHEQAMEKRFESACIRFAYSDCADLAEEAYSEDFANRVEAAIEAHRPAIENAFASACGSQGSLRKCASFEKRYPGFKSSEDIANARLYLNQACKLKEPGWIYQGDACKSGLAHGNGKAINSAKSLSYAGRFENGLRVQGKLFFNGIPMYDGPIHDSRPNGPGICFHEGEPEECKYYEGKRVDTLYKQRIELARQQEIIDEKLRKLEQSQKNQIEQIRAQSANQRAQPTRSYADGMTNALINEGQKRISEKIFDSLF